ncbi:peptide chain release factor N(5)-glutamine methyltransferase [Paenibacillus sp. PvR098]|uniref:peptide chain release factor N(5)-glutamine methyltransferase n=1 Tax=unclassified Paenibacillus TaxID=185978 RepID=UPI001B64AFC0|nr:release factor glutamine methyltransferase [Paenibacillus sp. PvP091]MBP1171396.1 release factor glutamine methyltransferase [Paenibacillus sp. PvR098]MBP2442424.1 release factor glutamine methyltransferase [Paenibacillus sp. PvP052]
MREERPMTIREAYAEASSFLRRSGVGEPEANAGRLLEYLLGESRSGLLLRWPEPFPQERDADWQRLIERKASGEPVQYIVGEQEFYGLPYAVTPEVLIPRPETELLVEQVILLGRQLWDEGEEPAVADVGTGSGAIAVSLAVQCPRWRVMASDISPGALEVAQANAARHGVAERVAFMEGDLLGPWIERGERLDLVVSNPPYIPEADEAGLQPEVRLFEPRTALYGGEDGMEPYRRLTAQLAELPAVPAMVGFEVGMGQAGEVRHLLERAADWDEIRIVPDLAGIERHVIAFRRRR